MKVHIQAKLIKKQQLNQDIYQYSVQAEEIAKQAKPGQFLEIRVTDQVEPFLRRPISIYNIEKETGIVEFIFQIKGKGTKILAQKQEGETIDLLGPLGYGTFKIKNYKNVAILGGGIGIFPLYELAKQLKQTTQANIHTYLGFRSKEHVILEEKFQEISHKLTITTDDGSYAQKGLAINQLKQDLLQTKPDILFACGPLPMLKAIQQLSQEQNIPCQLSLEEKMGCGLGVCEGCAVKITSGTEPRYGYVCKEGPVFYANEVEIG